MRYNKKQRKEKVGEKVHYTYLLECSDHTFYIGYTNDLQKRINTHNAKKGAKYTRGRTPVVLKYYEQYKTKTEAMRREHELKKLTRKQKEELIASDDNPVKRQL